MKTTLKHLTIIAIIFNAIPQLHSQGYIVPNGVITNYVFGVPGEISVVHDPTNYVYTGFILKPKDKTPPTTTYTNTFMYDAVVDVSVRVFLVSSNQPMSLQPILAQSYPELALGNNYVFNSGVPFYVGLFTGNQNFYPPDGIYPDPLFGWAQLVNNRGVIQLLDSAIEYKGGGIYVGTQNIIGIPEPSTFALAAVGAILSGRRLRRNPTP